jgi:hypothetical protein
MHIITGSRVLIFFLSSLAVFGGVAVTSREQFQRLKADNVPASLRYNTERAYVELPPGKNCPADGKAFFFLHINKEGEVETARGSVVALSADLKGIAIGWVSALLKQLHFTPLLYGAKASAVETAVTVFCGE